MNLKTMVRECTRFICLLLAVCMLSGVPAVKADAAVGDQGIDVSKWQGAVNWAAVAQSGVKFAFIKVGSLKSGIDEYFYYNMMAAQAVGIKTGVYIYSYARSVEEAALEAQFVLNAIQNVQVSYPVVWDVEDDTQENLSPDMLGLMANTFCAIIEAEGYYPMVYANKYWLTQKIGPLLYDKWVAQWGPACEVPDTAIWQYSCKGAIPGILGDVDLDIAFRDYSTSIVNTGWVPRKGFLYYYINYKMQRGWLDLGLAKYYLDAQGRMITGWLPLEDGIYYMQPDGAMSVGFTPIGLGMYYFGLDGRMQTGLQAVNGLYYYFAPDGVMYVGFLDLPDGRRFFANDGHMLVGLNPIGDKLYYFDANGIMQTGFQNIGGLTYLFGADGAMALGWFNDGVYSYYFAPEDGHMVTGLQIIDGKTYMFDANGRMITGVFNMNGLSYLFGADGAMYTGWLNDGITAKYYEADGHMAVGLTTIGADIYYFDINGNMQTGLVDIGGMPYLFGLDGKMVIMQ